jgi:hypothetical protein
MSADRVLSLRGIAARDWRRLHLRRSLPRMSGFPRHFLEPPGELIELPFARECGGLVPGRYLRRDLRQRRFLIHGGDGAVKFEILGPFGKASGFQQRGSRSDGSPRPSRHIRSSAGFTITTCVFEFSVHTGHIRRQLMPAIGVRPDISA